jgi:hypothetical protein
LDDTTQAVSILFLTLTFACLVILTQFIRRRRDLFALRRIPAYESVPAMVGRSIETGRPLHLSFGSAEIGSQTTVLAAASAELAYEVTQRAAIGDSSPIITFTAGSTLPLAQDTLRRAYQYRGLSERYSAINARWLPAGENSLAFAAGVTGLLGDDRAAANVLAGSFGLELALIMEAGVRRRLPQIAVSDRLQGQAVAYVFADEPLIGEEVFAGGAYLGDSAVQVGQLVTLDILRWLLIFTLIASFAIAARNTGG